MEKGTKNMKKNTMKKDMTKKSMKVKESSPLLSQMFSTLRAHSLLIKNL